MENKQKIKQINKKKTKLRIFLYSIIAAVVILLIFISPLFSVKNIKITDTNDEIKRKVMNMLDGAEGKNGFLYISENVSGIKNIDYLLGLRAKEIEDNIMFSMPELKNVKVKFDFPDTLRVSFGERTPAYLINVSGTYVCADTDGFILSIHTDKTENDLPVITGIDIQEFKVGQYISLKDDNQVRILKSVFTEIYNSDDKNVDFKLSSCIEIVDISEYNEIWLFIDGNITAKLGDIDNIEYKIPALKEILLSGNILGNRGMIDFTSSNNPVFRPET